LRLKKLDSRKLQKLKVCFSVLFKFCAFLIFILEESEKAKQKAIADMKSEIKHLYDSINEKDCELASTHADISVCF